MENNEEKLLIGLMKEYGKALDERNAVKIKILKTLFLVSSTIFVISVNFNNDIKMGNIVFLLPLLLNAFCIIFCLISLYGYVVVYNRYIRQVANNLQTKSYVLHQILTLFFDPNEVKMPKFFLVCEIFSFVSFLLLIVFLTFLSILK